MKNNLLFGRIYNKTPQLKQFLRVMRITVFILTTCLFCSYASVSRSQNARVTINKSNVQLSNVLDEIESQTDYLFVYNNEVDVNRAVSVKAKEKPVNKVLSSLLDNTDTDYAMEGTHIILTKHNETGASSSTGTQQSARTVSGTVVDSKGEAVIGASVEEKGTSNGTATDADGKFTLSVQPGATLVVSYIGYNTEQIAVGNQSSLRITLTENVKAIDEVVVIGYGTVKKSDLTGSVGSVSNNQIKDQPLMRIDNALKGRAAGVMVVTNSGSPDASIQVRIRGANSIYGGNNPLYIIDGIPAPALDANTNDIQSIEILKDASATAIYGSRGANGVVIVTTKRGAAGKTVVTFETMDGMSRQAKKYDMLSPYDFAVSWNENSGGNAFTQEQLSAFQNGSAGTNWQDLIFRTGYSQNHKLTLSGGSGKTHYYISGNVVNSKGILICTDLTRYALRSNIQSDITDWLKLDMDMSGYAKETNGSQGTFGNIGSPILDALTYSPTTPLYNPDGTWGRDGINNAMMNPVGQLKQYQYNNNGAGATANLKLTFILPVKGLTVNIQGAGTYGGWTYFNYNSIANKLNSGYNGATNVYGNNWNLYNLDQVNYVNQWGDHKLTAMVAGEFTKYTSTQLDATTGAFPTDVIGWWNLGLGDLSKVAWSINNNHYNRTALASFFGRVMYSFKDRYMLTATIRRDGTSVFQGGNKWGTFPSGSVAWRASEESFIKNLHVFDNLKLRASYGVTGNQAIGAYSTLGLLTSSNSSWGDPANKPVPGYVVGSPPTTNLGWEKTYQSDLGLDMGFFRNRLSVDIDFYNKNTKNLLLQKTIPLYDGGGSQWVNLGAVRNRGIDFSLTGVILQSRDWNWESTLNFSYNQNRVMDLGGRLQVPIGSQLANGVTINTALLAVGQPIGSIQGYTWLGLWKTAEAAEAAKYGRSPGDNHFKGVINSDGKITYDIGKIGCANPDKFLGWNNTFSWKRFDLNVFFQGAFGAQHLNLGRFLMNGPTSDVHWMTEKSGWYDRWTPDNENTWVTNPFSKTNMIQAASTQFLENADYLRLNNLSLSYTLPKKVIKVCDLTLSLSAQNLVTFTHYKGGDPETTYNSAGSMNGGPVGSIDANAGIDAITYPISRTYTIGAKLAF